MKVEITYRHGHNCQWKDQKFTREHTVDSDGVVHIPLLLCPETWTECVQVMMRRVGW